MSEHWYLTQVTHSMSELVGRTEFAVHCVDALYRDHFSLADWLGQ